MNSVVSIKGFSLIELIVFILVLGVFTGSVIRLNHQSTQDIPLQIHQANTVLKAQSLLEKIASKNYSEIKLQSNNKIVDKEGFNYSISVRHSGESFDRPIADVKLITITVKLLTTESMTLSTYRFDN